MLILLSVIVFDLYSLWKAFDTSINSFQVWWQQLNLISPPLSHSPAGYYLPCRRGRHGRQTLPEFIAVHPSLEKNNVFKALVTGREMTSMSTLGTVFFYVSGFLKTLSQCLHFPNNHMIFALIFRQQKMIIRYMYMIHNNNLDLYSNFKSTLYFTCFLCAQTLCVQSFIYQCVHECPQTTASRISCLGLCSDSLDRHVCDSSLMTRVWSSKHMWTMEVVSYVNHPSTPVASRGGETENHMEPHRPAIWVYEV